AGTQKANESFGITIDMLKEGKERVLSHHQERGQHRDIESSGHRAIGRNLRSPDHPITRSPDSLLDPESQTNSALSEQLGINVMYFETGQGSALSAGAHHGVDELTLEARVYGMARVFEPFLVNSVVGFIGPEYLYDERQIIRAGLEDHFMGKLLGLPMGCDVCYTNHAAADQNS